VYVVAGQLFAQKLSLTKGYNPDQPRHLAKITRTF
jgi:glucosamine 6-phosphate synthetase-like amidotransferase/phosphosugar isomerase protein